LTYKLIGKELSHFQNSVSFGNGFGKTSLTTGFSTKSKVAFPKTEVLEKPQLLNFFGHFILITNKMKFKASTIRTPNQIQITPHVTIQTLLYLKNLPS